MRPRRPPYDPEHPIWWGINENGTPNEQKLQEIVAAIVRAANPERIVLFGSAANGTMDQDSDLDLLVVMETTRPRKTAQQLRSRAPRKCPPLDIVVATAADVERTQHDPLFVTHDALMHGRVLYHAKP